MRIALYYPWVYLRSGVERMILETVRRSRHEWVVFTSHYDRGQTFAELGELPVVELKRLSVDRGYSFVAGAALTIMKQKIDLGGFDALVVSSEGLGDFITFRNHDIPVVCYCHTPLAVVHDPFMRKAYLDGNRRMVPYYHFFAGAFKFFDRYAWKRYDHVFCNSEESRRRVLDARLAGPERIEVLNPGLDVQLLKASDEFQREFLVVSRFKWVKNLELAVRAYKEFRLRHPQYADFRLRIMGLVEPRSVEYYNWLWELAGDQEGIVFERDPSEEEILAAYASCYCLLFTSPNEAWGMVPLEAMGAGKPVIAVNRGGPVESIISGETGILSEEDPAGFADAMARLAADEQLARRMGAAGSERVQMYDWDRFVGRLDDYLDGYRK
ncbi:MAG: glycosyltransferase [Thermoleophilia bacterium]